MTSVEILTVIKLANDTFDDIAKKPTDNDMSPINKILLPILLKIPYNQVEATHNLSGLIAPSAKYRTKSGTAFKRSKRPELYCPTNTATMSDSDWRKSEGTNSARRED